MATRVASVRVDASAKKVTVLTVNTFPDGSQSRFIDEYKDTDCSFWDNRTWECKEWVEQLSGWWGWEMSDGRLSRLEGRFTYDFGKKRG